MGRSWAHTAQNQWVGQIYCDRPRCDVKHTWPVTNPPTAFRTPTFRTTPEQRAAHDAAAALAQAELDAHELPPGWVRVHVVDPSSITDRTRYFHTTHCAALWLNAYPTRYPVTVT